MARDNYNERKENREAYYLEQSEKQAEKSTRLSNESRKMVECIPMGQPILVGHHSEAGHRNLLKKSWNKLGQSVEAGKKSDYYADKAEAVRNNNAISSDDPEAVVKLKEKIASLQASQDLMKAANKIIKSKKKTDEQKKEELLKLGLKESHIVELNDTGRKWWGAGFAPFELTNNNANIRRLKKRLEALQAEDREETTEREIYGLKVVDSLEVNRIQIYFDGKPEQEVRNMLKRSGFRWSPRFSCWQAYRSAKYKTESFLKWYKENIYNE